MRDLYNEPVADQPLDLTEFDLVERPQVSVSVSVSVSVCVRDRGAYDARGGSQVYIYI